MTLVGGESREFGIGYEGAGATADSADSTSVPKIAPAPKESLPERVRRWRRSLAALSPLSRWVITWGAVLVGIDAALFVATAIWSHDAGAALDIALTVRSPFSTRADATAVPLAAFTVFLVPAIVGAVVGLVVEYQLRQMERTEGEVKELIARLAPKPRAEDSPDTPA